MWILAKLCLSTLEGTIHKGLCPRGQCSQDMCTGHEAKLHLSSPSVAGPPSPLMGAWALGRRAGIRVAEEAPMAMVQALLFSQKSQKGQRSTRWVSLSMKLRRQEDQKLKVVPGYIMT